MLLPSVLPRAGESLADDGLEHGGWALRRTDGSTLDMARTLAAQGVRDGEILHLTPRYEQWPEVEYDDVVDAIAEGSRRYGLQWSGAATRATGLAAGVAILLGALVLVLRAGPPWSVPAVAALVVAVALLGAGVVVARVVPDAVAGALIGAVARRTPSSVPCCCSAGTSRCTGWAPRTCCSAAPRCSSSGCSATWASPPWCGCSRPAS